MRDRVGHGAEPPVNAPTRRCKRLCSVSIKAKRARAGHSIRLRVLFSLRLNHERYAEEVKQGLHEKKKGRAKANKPASASVSSEQKTLFE